MNEKVWLVLCLLLFSSTQSIAGPTPEQAAKIIQVLRSPDLALDMLVAFDKEKLVGAPYGQARAAAAKQFLVNRGIDASLIEVRHNVVSEAYPFLVIPKLVEGTKDLYLFPSASDQLLRNKDKPFAFLPVWGDLARVAHEASLANDSSVTLEQRKLNLIVDSAQKTDLSRFDGMFNNIGRNPLQRVGAYFRGCLRSLTGN